MLRKLSPEQRPIVAWLLNRGALTEDDIEGLLELGGPRELRDHVIALVYDCLKPEIRRAAEHLSGRESVVITNDISGACDISNARMFGRAVDTTEGSTLPVAVVRALVECGFLQPIREPAEEPVPLKVPRFVRIYIQKHQRARGSALHQ